MYARSTTIQGKPANIDAGIKFVINEAVPVLDSIEGCRGLSLLVDRESGQCIATSSWSSEASMMASNDQMRPFRERGREILGGGMQVDDWEIVLMHRSQHGECCRVTWLEGDVDAAIETFRVGVMPQLEQMSGFCSVSLMVNRETGLGCASTAWQTRGAMEASRAAGEEMRTRTANDSGGQIVDVHEFELAYAHLHVPEMA